MIRKQFYLESVQKAALKRKARELGISEAKLVRRALDVALGEPIRLVTSQNLALERVLKNSLRLPKIYRLSDADQLERDDAYSSEQRFTRWE